MSARPSTLADVALRAGVSLKTASRALNGEPHVAEATREEVRKAASELGYRPNPAAIALAKAKRRNQQASEASSQDLTPARCTACGAIL